MSSSRVCVIVPAYNEEAVIADCLDQLAHQDYSNYEVIVVDDQSTDCTRQVIEKYVRAHPKIFRLKEYGKVGPGKARNLSAYETMADLLLFTDADCIPEKAWISELANHFTDPKVGSVGGPHLCPENSNSFQKSVELFLKLIPGIGFYRTHKGSLIRVRHNPLCNVAYRREIFAQLRGFREDLFPGEDVEFDQRVRRLGYQILYNPAARVFHHRPENIDAWKKVMHAYGRAQGKLVRESGPRRVIQWMGVLTISSTPLIVWLLYSKFHLVGLYASTLLLFALFFLRPRWNNLGGIFLNSTEWLNGFIEGFITKRSDPPGFNRLSLNEKAARLRK